ncbi:complex I subunit 1/NuoH family protein [Paraliomyxa miuraensis]|uniref:complex I subunit 1/NuoH family protein n=1 Tax=Paraliomyxa miuraensis TaxID=376150 RepID=UPI002B1CDFBA|nr:complex I subunit 1 family protein [Paraliomyxa miuraensis]
MTQVTSILSSLAESLRRHAGVLRSASVLTLAVLLGVLSTACGEPPTATEDPVAVRTEPGELVFHPDTRPVAVSLVNISEKPVVIGRVRVDESTPDWVGFAVGDDAKPGRLAPGERMTFHVGVDSGYFLGSGDVRPVVEAEGEQLVADDEYREGKARLAFTVDGQDHGGMPIRFEDPSWVGQYLGPALVKILLLVMGFIMPLASLLTWMERKQSAMMQDRLGPNMAALKIGGANLRLWGIPHFIADGVKMLFKEDFIPRKAHRALYSAAPLFAFIPALVVFAIVPFGDALCYDRMLEPLSAADVAQCADGRGGTPLQIAQIDVGLLYYFAVASLATYGTALAGWSSYNKWAILGALRASAQMISYEVAIGLTIVGALLVYGTLEPHALVKAQESSYWGIALQPLAFVLFFTAAMAETKRAPFDLPEGESEIIGYFIEYSGMRFGLFFLGEFIEVIFMSAMLATLFLGGWGLPFGMLGPAGFSSPLMAQLFLFGAGAGLTVMGVAAWRTGKAGELFGATVALVGIIHLFIGVWSLFTGWGTEIPHILVVGLGMIIWGGKVFLLCGVQLLIRWTLPRFRYDQLMSLGWKGLLPLSIANIVLTAILVYLLMPGANPAS